MASPEKRVGSASRRRHRVYGALGGAVALVVAVAGCGSAPSPSRSPAPGSAVPASPLGAVRAPELDAPWPGFGRDVRHAAVSPATGPQTGRVRWRRQLEGPVVPGPAVGRDGTVYAASNAGTLHALDGATGRDRWTYDGGGAYGVDLSTTPAVLATGTVLWPGPRDALHALDARSGRLLWRAPFAAQPLSPLVDGDRVYVQDAGGTLTALRLRGRAAPRRLWSLHLGTSSYASAALGRDGTVYTAADDTLFAVRDGRVRWRVKTRGLVEVSPAVASDGTVTVGSNDRSQYGVSPAGKVRWRHDLGDLTYSSAATTPDGLVYVGDHRGQVSALDARTGRLRYRVLGRGRTAREKNVGVWTMPVVDARHDVYFGTHLGHLHGFDARGRRLLDVDLGGVVDSYPALTADGTLIVGSESGTLLALG